MYTGNSLNVIGSQNFENNERNQLKIQYKNTCSNFKNRNMLKLHNIITNGVCLHANTYN